jgi:hypothetical protein
MYDIIKIKLMYKRRTKFLKNLARRGKKIKEGT